MVFVLLLFAACSKWEARDCVDALPDIFPDYTQVTVPRGIAPLNFMVEGASHISVKVTNMKGDVLTDDGTDCIQLDEAGWQRITAEGGRLKVEVSVWDEKHPEGARYRPFDVFVSPDEIDPWIMYRLLPPGYEGWRQMGIYQRKLGSFEELTVMDNEQNRETCMNCHAALQNDPENFTFHQRGPGGFTRIRHGGKTEQVDLKALTGGRHGSHNAWHPKGRYIAFSSNDTKQIFYGKSRDKIEVFDLWSDLFIYDVENGRALLDDRFTNEEQLETYPCFSPDGKWLYFSVAKPVHLPDQYEALHYDLVRAPFDEETGTLGEVDTVYCCHERGGTALMPRLSPDGRFVLFTVSESGAFNLYHKEAELVMRKTPQRQTPQPPLGGDSIRKVDEGEANSWLPVTDDGNIHNEGDEWGEFVDCSMINSEDAESYHAWSTNGRWMMFSSKRIDGRYTRLFIAHWDGKEWGKPFLLPQRDPKQNTLLMMAYNVGEFLKRKYE